MQISSRWPLIFDVSCLSSVALVLLDHLIRNRQVIGSSPIVGSSKLLFVIHLAAAGAATILGVS
jgi:hypothetical protein